jgi:predicted aminopeptidase
LLIRRLKKLSRMKKGLILLALLTIAMALSGCQTFSFYRQAIKGQLSLITHQERIDKLIANPQTPARLKEQLQLVGALSGFADRELKLPVDGNYRKYVDVHPPFIVWNVEAAPEFSMEPKTWWYPLIGRQEYRGYFSENAAQKYARVVRKKGYDVYVAGTTAYSTLGWFKDPILNTFVFDSESDLAETLFHELAHQRVFARGDTDFNEAFATTVGQEGARRWLRSKGDTAAYEAYVTELRRNNQFVHLIMKTHERLEKLYGDERTEEGKVKTSRKKRDVPPAQLRAEKQRVFDDLREQYKHLKQQGEGNTGYDEWFAQQLNNAKLNSVAAYYDLVPGFQRLLELNGGNLEKFYQAAERLANQTKKERQQWLRTLATPPNP